MAEYVHLLSHLHSPSSSTPLDAINAAIARHLANLAPYPIPLAAAVVSSPLFRHFSHQKLRGLATAFRHASHLKHKALQDDKGTIFTRSNHTRFRQWISAVLKGLQGGDPIIRLSCCGGVLLALHDLDPKSLPGQGRHRSHVENEVVVALAEVMDKYAYMLFPGAWEREFRSLSDAEEVDALSLAMILASQSLPHVSSDKFTALPLQPFLHLLTTTIDKAFASGSFLSSLSSSVTITESSVIHISEESPFAQAIQSISESLLMSSIGPLSKLCARTLSLLVDSKPEQGILATKETLETLRAINAKVETHWASSPLSGCIDENLIAPDTRPITKQIWTILKTLLFSTLMITDACLSAFIYVPAHVAQRSSNSPGSTLVSSANTPASSLAQSTLGILSHLSFVISQFGGVGSTTEGGFTELKRVFYLALDILAADREASENFVSLLSESFHVSSPEIRNDVLYHAKKAYALAIIEQLVPVIGAKCIELQVLPLCLPHLSDSSHRETYESSHSVVLTAFSSHAQQVEEHFLDPDIGSYKGKEVDREGKRPIAFTDKLVPFYTNCLIENSADGKLSTPQLQLAFSALVHSASASASGADIPTLANDRYSLAWFCVETLLDAIRGLSETVSARTTGAAESSEERLHRLHLMLISTTPSLPLTLLARVLNEIRTIIVEHTDSSGQRKNELVQTLFEEILEKVADREKEFAMKWWYENREALVSHQVATSVPVSEESPRSSSRL